MGEEGPSPTHWVGFQWSRVRGSEVRVQAPPLDPSWVIWESLNLYVP